ncbi:hypothetical protein FPOAC2_11906 [Fusarium poae]|uniref:hypothetical protein n=1 Tax=Fusarium poae TaxID=36050 RepID=UPI001CEAF99C|nr:hypothetical protein FPOAC1_011598 [Fusarium poae]KAG8666781.1 hypothetical protein FPOAC1_011598 [Fusarium poae]
MFHLFSNLPPELRHEIWIETLPASQVHFLTRGPPYQGESKGDDIPLWLQNIISPPLPVALMINRESRRIALEHYRLFPKYPPHFYPPEQMPYGYFNPTEDILHIPNMMRSDDWNFGNTPFHTITFCVQEYDNPAQIPDELPETNEEAQEDMTSNLSEELIKMAQQRLSLGLVRPGESFAPRIILVAIDRQHKHHSDCRHIWPIGRPFWIMSYRRRLGFILSRKMPRTRPATRWVAELRKDISDKLDDETDKKRYLPEVKIGIMPLICDCPEVADTLRDGKYGKGVRYLEGYAREW